MDEVLRACIKVFKNSLEEEDSELVTAFEQAVKQKYEEYEFVLNTFNGGDLSNLKEMVMNYTENIASSSINQKRQVLIKDDNLKELQALEDKACQMAICVVHGKINREDKDKEIEYAKELYEKVREFNKANARIILSNIIMDLEFVSGKGIDTSVRVGIEIIKKELDGKNII